jgi:hypothetical protein
MDTASTVVVIACALVAGLYLLMYVCVYTILFLLFFLEFLCYLHRLVSRFFARLAETHSPRHYQVDWGLVVPELSVRELDFYQGKPLGVFTPVIVRIEE